MQIHGTFVSCHFALKMRALFGLFAKKFQPLGPVWKSGRSGRIPGIPFVFSEAFHGSMKSRNTFATRRPWQMVKRMSMRREIRKTIDPMMISNGRKKS